MPGTPVEAGMTDGAVLGRLDICIWTGLRLAGVKKKKEKEIHARHCRLRVNRRSAVKARRLPGVL